MHTGWILLYRTLLDWEWYHEPNTLRLFLHLLLRANHKGKRWQGVLVQSGQVITGRLKLSQELNLSERNIRTALKHLKMTNEISIKATKQYSIITINNWSKHQHRDTQNDQEVSNTRPTCVQKMTTNNNDNKENNDKEKGVNYESLSR